MTAEAAAGVVDRVSLGHPWLLAFALAAWLLFQARRHRSGLMSGFAVLALWGGAVAAALDLAGPVLAFALALAGWAFIWTAPDAFYERLAGVRIGAKRP